MVVGDLSYQFNLTVICRFLLIYPFIIIVIINHIYTGQIGQKINSVINERPAKQK